MQYQDTVLGSHKGFKTVPHIDLSWSVKADMHSDQMLSLLCSVCLVAYIAF